ncbi:MAG TPA: 4-demethylwyosine synthase TYW1 [Candidatus Thermoplasmatota archaeon]|nr:4-demethylwyosine synthase TYW1 [Candidatus Thermoplasmatota archaeon]
MRPDLQRVLEKQGYGVVGNHSGVKLCHWTKEDLRSGRHCYKGDFYGIGSRECMQMTPIVDYCNFACLYCWRSQSFDTALHDHAWDAPAAVLEGGLDAQRRLLSGYKGHPTTPVEKWVEAQSPKHVAISLNGEPTFYPHLGEFIELCHRRGMTTFLVTNGSRPDVLRDLDPLPTQLYVSIDAPNQEVFDRLCAPIGAGAWDKLEETIDLLPSLDTRIVARHTLVKGWNMEREKGHVEQYAALDRRADPDFVEAKGYVFVGASRERMTIENMPRHEDVLGFADALSSQIGYPRESDKRDSRVALLVKAGVARKLDLDAWEKAHKVEDHPAPRIQGWARLAAAHANGAKDAKPVDPLAVAAACTCGHPHEAHVVGPDAVPGAAPRAPNVTFGKTAMPASGDGCCGGP